MRAEGAVSGDFSDWKGDGAVVTVVEGIDAVFLGDLNPS